MQQLRQWFNNHTGVRVKKVNRKILAAKIRTSGKQPRDPFAPVLMGGGADRPKQKLQPRQAFSAMLQAHGASLKPAIDAEWKAKIEQEPELLEIKGSYLLYFTMRMGQMYDEATPEVKAQVEAFREQEYQKNLASSAPPPLLFPHEEGLPQADKEQLLEIRTNQR